MANWLWTCFCFTKFENDYFVTVNFLLFETELITMSVKLVLVASHFKIQLFVDFFLTAVPGSHAGSRYLIWAFGFSATTKGITCHKL